MHAYRSFTGLALVAFGAGTFFATVRAEAATSCTADADCGHGYTCQTTGSSSCPKLPNCPDGSLCPTPICDPVVTKTCELGPCTVDSDCAAGMGCLITSVTGCTGEGTACMADASCPPPPPPTCETTTSGVCAPKYDLPCQANSDCGSGFTCVPAPCACASSGGGGVGYSSGGATSGTAVDSGPIPSDAATVDAFIIVPVPAQDAGQEISLPIDASCTCPAVPQNECSLNSIPCTVDTECPSSWTCVTPPVAICGCPNIVLLDGSTPPCDCPEASSSGGSCVPPNWTPRSGSSSTGSGSVPLSFGDASAEDGGVAPGATTGGNDGTIDGGGSSSSSGGSSPSGSSSSSSGGGEVFVDAGHGVASYPGDAAGATGATGTGTSSGTDAAVSTGGGSGPSAASNSNDQAKDSSSGGCQIGEGRGASSVPGFFGMALLAIGASALRRRRVSPQRVR